MGGCQACVCVFLRWRALASLYGWMEGPCSYPGCGVLSKLRCSQCKTVNYCGGDHQKLDWKAHKSRCTPSTIGRGERAAAGESNGTGGEKRQCTCMFCGETLMLDSEEAAIEHMSTCCNLQEQLDSKDQFTIPSAMRDKMSKS